MFCIVCYFHLCKQLNYLFYCICLFIPRWHLITWTYAHNLGRSLSLYNTLVLIVELDIGIAQRANYYLIWNWNKYLYIFLVLCGRMFHCIVFVLIDWFNVVYQTDYIIILRRPIHLTSGPGFTSTCLFTPWVNTFYVAQMDIRAVSSIKHSLLSNSYSVPTSVPQLPLFGL